MILKFCSAVCWKIKKKSVSFILIGGPRLRFFPLKLVVFLIGGYREWVNTLLFFIFFVVLSKTILFASCHQCAFDYLFLSNIGIALWGIDYWGTQGNELELTGGTMMSDVFVLCNWKKVSWWKFLLMEVHDFLFPDNRFRLVVPHYIG